MPAAPDPITSPPEKTGQPYDAASAETLSKWESVDRKSGPANESGNATGDFDSGPSPWVQT